MSLLPVAQAQARLLALAAPLPIETVPLIDAVGRWAAADVVARRTQPDADLSMMDGYAIRFADRAGPWRLIGESRAGQGYDGIVETGDAVRIFTGAPMPKGADTVLIQEDADQKGDQIGLTGEAPGERGSNIRVRGSDFGAGTVLAARGDRFTPGRIAAAAIGGHGTVPVRRKPRMKLISTGDELVAPGVPTEGAMLPASNGVMLRAMIGSMAEIYDAGIIPDQLDALVAAFGAAQTDIIVTTGGASVGDHDLIRPALIEAGAAIDFWRIGMRPGKPLLAGTLGDTIVLGLPGNPVSAFVTAQLFLLPLIAHMGGARSPIPQTEPAVLAAPLPTGGSRDEYLRATIENGAVTALPNQDSAALSTLALANALIVRAAGSPPAHVGETVDILRIA